MNIKTRRCEKYKFVAVLSSPPFDTNKCVSALKADALI